MKTVTRDEIIGMLQARQGERSLRQFAATIPISAAYLSDLYRGNREAGPRILNMLKLRKRKTVAVVYERNDTAGREKGGKRWKTN